MFKKGLTVLLLTSALFLASFSLLIRDMNIFRCRMPITYYVTRLTAMNCV